MPYKMMSRIIYLFLPMVFTIFSPTAWADSTSLLNQAKAADPARYQFAVNNNAEIRNTSDNKAFTIWWQPSSSAPTGVIVNLHGHGSYATDGLYLWHPYLLARGYAILSLQWWFGGGETVADYYRPQDMYPIIASLLKEKGIKPGTVLLHGYSRGSANSYAVTALDTFSGNRYFNMTLSNAGGAASDYPPNQQIVAGAFGSLPFNGIQWVMYCGELDPDPTINGCPAMNAAKDWVIKYGATFKLLIEDPSGGHGGFQTNSTNVDTALAQFVPAASQPVVEFYNATLDNYFITADANEATAIDGGSAGPGWIRTDNSFKSGGSTPVCRFYGSYSPGPNSHFYTVDQEECQALKDQQIPTDDPRKHTDKSWNFESLDFISRPPTNGVCPSGTTPVYRAYNNGFTRSIDSNHRITSSLAAILEVVSRGWSNEGVVMCAPN